MTLARKKLPLKKTLPYWMLVGVGASNFAYSLGFMTRFYDFFFAGTAETYQYYKELQVVNHYIFNASLLILLLAAFCFISGFVHKRRNWLFLAVLAGFGIYFINTTSVLMQTIPYFEGWYRTLDLGTLPARGNPSFFLRLTYIFPILATLATGTISWQNFRKPLERRESIGKKKRVLSTK